MDQFQSKKSRSAALHVQVWQMESDMTSKN